MPGPIDINSVELARTYEVLERAAQHVRDARGGNAVTSRDEMRDYLAQLPDGKERTLANLFFKFIDHRDRGRGNRVTEEDIEGTLAYAKQRLLGRLDANHDGSLTNQEIAGISRIGRLAWEIAKQAGETPPPGSCPALGYGEQIDRAIADGLMKVEGDPCHIRFARVTSDYDHQDATNLLSSLLQLEGADHLERFNLGLISQWDGDDSYGSAIAALAGDGVKAKLKDVVIGDFTQEESEISWVTIGDISPLYSVVPNLEALKVRGGGIALGNLDLPKLESLTLESGGLPAGAIGSIDRANLPNLKKLEIWFGSSEYGAEGNAAMLGRLMTGAGVPKLKDLGLQNAEFSDQIAAAIVDAPILRQLERLDLSMGTLTDAGAETLASHAQGLSHLREINVDDNYLTQTGIAALQRAFGDKVKIGTQDKYDPESPNDRYVSVGE